MDQDIVKHNKTVIVLGGLAYMFLYCIKAVDSHKFGYFITVICNIL